MSPDHHEHEESAETNEMLFRVIAGLQRGAEMRLQPGAYIIGASEDCDIVLKDDAISDKHFAIEVSEGELTFKAHDGAMAVGDKLLQPGEETNSATPVAISLGETVLGIGARGTDWNTLSVPDLAAMLSISEGDASEQSEETEISELAEGDDTSDAGDSSDEIDQESEGALDNAPSEADPLEHGELDNGEASSSGLLASLNSHRRIAAGAAFLVFAGAAAFFTMQGSGDAQEQAEAAQIAGAEEPKGSDKIRKRFADARLLEVEVMRDHRGVYHLSGYVADKTARKVMYSLLDDVQISFHDQVRQVDEIMRAVEFSLEKYSWPASDFNQHLVANYIGGGIFAIDGYLGPEVDRTDLNRQIVMDAPGVVRVDFKRARLADWQAELDEELGRAGLTPWIKTNIVNGAILVSGEITPKEAKVWREIGQRFVAKSRGRPRLNIAVRAAGAHHLNTSGMETPIAAVAAPAPVGRSDDINIIGVIMPSDGRSRVLLNNGASRAEGEALYDGAVLHSISLNKITVRKEGEIQEHYVGEQG